MAKRSKLTPQRQKRICDAIRKGLHLDRAARLGGINPRTFYKWLERGENEGSGPYFNFLQAVREAEAKAEEYLLGLIQGAAEGGSWQAAAWILERRHPERWARTDRLIAKHSHSGSVNVVVKFGGDDEGNNDQV